MPRLDTTWAAWPTLVTTLAASDALAAVGPDAARQSLIALAFAVLLVAVLLGVLGWRSRQLGNTRRALAAALAERNPVLAALPEMVWLKDLHGRYLSTNPAFAKLTGTSELDCIGKTDFDLFDTPTARQWRSADRRAINSGGDDVEERWLTLDQGGYTGMYRLRRRPLYDGDGRLVGVLGIARDITEQYKAAEELRRREGYQRALLDNAPFLVWLKDTNGRMLAANQQVAQLAGKSSSAELIGRSDFELFPVELATSYQANDRLVMSTGKARESVDPIDTPSGARHWVESYKAPVFDDRGRLLGTVGFARDVTQRQELQQRLRDGEQRFRSLFEHNSSVMLLIDPASGRIRAANAAAAAFYGYGLAELATMSVDALNTLSPGEVARARDAALHSEGKKFHFRHRLKSGEIRDVEVYSTPINSDGEALLFSIVHDVTEQRRAERALQREHDLFANGPVVVFSWAAREGWPVLSVSANCASVLGYDQADLTAAEFHFADLVHADDQARVATEVTTLLANGVESFEQSYRLKLKYGGYAWFHDFTRVIRDRDGTIAEVRGYLFDETALKTAELSLAEQRDRLAGVIEGTRAGTWEWNVQTGAVRFNERWAQIVGYTLDELQPVTIETWMRLAHPDDLAESQRALKRHFDGEAAHYEAEVRMRHKAGHWVWVIDRGRVLEWTEEGAPLWMFGTHQDITDRKEAELAVAANERRLRVAGRLAFDLIYEWDTASNRLDWYGDPSVCLGLASGTIGQHLDDWLALIHPEDRTLLEGAIGLHRADATPYEHRYRVRHADGSYRHWLDKATPVLDEQGRPLRWIGVCSDISERQAAEERQRLASAVFRHAHEGILITDAKARIVDVNAAFTEITGYRRDEVIGHNPRLLSSGRQDETFYAAMWARLDTHGYWTGEIWNRRKDGQEYPELLSISAVQDVAGKVQNYVALFYDITQQKAQQKRLEHIAYYDALTDLPNRVLLGDRLRHAMKHVERHQLQLAVVYLDLDGFKEINDTHGHEVGDHVLVEVATRLRHAIREEDSVARIGGDEFVVILSDLADPGSCVQLLPRLLHAAAAPIELGGATLQVSASLGVTLYPPIVGSAQPADHLHHDRPDPDQLLRQADQAMYQAKLAGKNRYHVFDAEQDRNIRGQIECLEAIGRALRERELVLYYQPKVNMRSGAVIGCEALVRWPQADGSVRLPGEFLPLIENHPLAVELDEWVMDEALDQLERWHDEGLALTVSVNLSAQQLQRDDFVARLQEILARHPRIDPGMLVIEVLETTALMDLARISQVIRTAQALGVVFALDDFGTGYSSLDYLKNLPARQLKIDHSFVRNMLDDRDDLAILEGIMGLAAAFSREAVAEGVESVEHGEILLLLGCELAQGYHIARPMPAAQIAAWARDWRPHPLWQQQQRIAREDLPLMFALVEHRAWVKAVASQLNGRHLALPALDATGCPFAGWLHGDGVRRYGEHPRFATICDLHDEIHALAPQVLALRVGGEDNRAHLRLDELYRLRDTLVTQLKGLLHEVRT